MKRSTKPCLTCGKRRFVITHTGQRYCSVSCGRRSSRYAGKTCWTPAEDAVLRARFPHEPTAVVAKAIGRSLAGTHQRAHSLGLEKTAAYLASPAACRLRRGDNIGAPFRFKKGQTPSNKGLRRPGWHRGRMKETQFKKGHSGTRTMPVGATRLVDGYIYVKVAAIPNVPHTKNWLPLHILEWERANGPVPAGHAIAFRNGDKSDVRLDNLECITKASVMKRNSYHNYPQPIPKAIQLIGALNRQIRRRENADGKKQEPIESFTNPMTTNDGTRRACREETCMNDFPCPDHEQPSRRHLDALKAIRRDYALKLSAATTPGASTALAGRLEALDVVVAAIERRL